VQRLDPEQTSAAGIVIPDTAAEKPTQGKVIAVGSGKVLENGDDYPLSLAVGDRILFGKYAGTEVEVSGDTLLVLREEDVLGVIET
jgi:chaperonin GroES